MKDFFGVALGVWTFLLAFGLVTGLTIHDLNEKKCANLIAFIEKGPTLAIVVSSDLYGLAMACSLKGYLK